MKNINKVSLFFAGILMITGLTASNFAQAACASWGWDRVNQHYLPLDNVCETGSAAGTHLYVVDTGINATLNEFGGNVSYGYSTVPGGTSDANGHGTCLTSIAAGYTHGYAMDPMIHPVRVLNPLGSGSISGIIDGLYWVLDNGVRPGVVLLGLGGGASQTIDRAVEDLIAAGFVVVVTAGNENQDACNMSPARVNDAITVASTNSWDQRSSFSNYGTCVDICAPGNDIKCATGTFSGGSMAAAHVAGAALVALRDGHCYSSSSCKSYLVATATKDVVSNPMGECPLLYI